VIVAATVEAVLLSRTVDEHLSFVGSMFGGSIRGRPRRHPRCPRCGGLVFLREGDAAPSFATGVALLVGGFVLVRELEDLIVSARDGVGSREGIIVDLLLEVPVGLVAEAVEE
jgi:hypothetical protein